MSFWSKKKEEEEAERLKLARDAGYQSAKMVFTHQQEVAEKQRIENEIERVKRITPHMLKIIPRCRTIEELNSLWKIAGLQKSQSAELTQAAQAHANWLKANPLVRTNEKSPPKKDRNTAGLLL